MVYWNVLQYINFYAETNHNGKAQSIKEKNINCIAKYIVLIGWDIINLKKNVLC